MTLHDIRGRVLWLGASLFSALTAYAGTCESGGQVPLEGCPIWDGDCDSISTVVELNPPNSRYGFDPTRPDVNRSLAVGSPGNGSLTDGLNLFDVQAGYYHYFPGGDPRWDQPDSNDWAILRAINIVEATAREWVDFRPRSDTCAQESDRFERAFEFGVGDLSKLGGGLWLHSYDSDRRHVSHQNGLDIDVRYLRKDQLPFPLELRGPDSVEYDVYATVDLINCFLKTFTIDAIFLDTATAHIWNDEGGTTLRNDTAHHSHFHVRIRRP